LDNPSKMISAIGITKAPLLTLALLLIASTNILGQSDSLRSKDKLTKNDQIWLAAYDDTTEALASLFITKRNKIIKRQRANLIGFGVSAIVLGVGAYMIGNNSSSSTTAMDEGTDYAGLLLTLVGVSGVITTGVGFGVQSIQLNPYTEKKYYSLIELYKSGKPLPEFYVRKITPFLRRK